MVDSFLEITEEKLHTWWGELKDKIDIAYKFYLTDNYFQEVVVRRGGISFDRAVGLPFEQNEIDAQLQAPPGDHGSHRIGTGAEQYNGNHHENESNSTEDTLGALGMLPASTTAAQTTAEKPGRAVSFAKTIEKTHFSTLENGNRFVFVAGLEGVGHHSMSFLFNKCRRDRVCSASSELSKLVYNNCHKPRGVIQTQGYDIGDPKKAQRAFVRSLQRLESKRKMSTPALNAGRGRLFFLNTHNSRGLSTGTSGMMSYPNCPPWELYPDIVIMAKLMEEAGVDFRVLVLHRPSHSIMRSTITNRSHRKPGEEERVLAHGAAVLYTMLSGLDSKFFRVVEYHELNQRDTWEGAGGLKEFLLGRKGSYPDFAMQLTSERVDKAKRERDHPYFTPGFFPAEDEHLWGASERLAFFNDKLLTLKE